MAKIKTKGTDSHKTRPKGMPKHAFERVYWPYIPIVLAISLLLGLSVNGGNLQAYMRHPGGRVLDYATSMTINGLLADTNAARSSNGIAPLSLNNKLDASAQAKADDMAARNYWSHNTPDGNPPWIFVTAQGYSYQKLGENLATGFGDEQSTIDGWMASPPHRENLLDPDFKDVGFGFANNPNYTAAGGGPMTIIVAHYGEPIPASAPVAAVQTPAPQSTVHGATTTPVSSEQQPPASPAPATNPDSSNQGASEPVSKPGTNSKQPATTQTAPASLASSTKQSRIQLALKDAQLSSASTSIVLLGAIFIGFFWASRHLRALHKFLLKGERYAVRHPLTDLGLIIIGGLLFILSQAAGLIQ